jgi:chromosomal replication initiator protein
VPDQRPHTACADYIKRPKVVCTTAVDFARELADAIETQAVEEFRAKHRGAAMLVVEDLGQLATRKSGKLSAQEELVHTLDALVAEGRWVVVTAAAPPWELPGIVPMLQSRLTGGLVVRLAPPEREARLALLEQLAAILEIKLPEPVAQVLAEGLSGTARDLAGALLELRQMAEAEGALDLAAARQYVAGRNRSRQTSVHEIALATARHFSLRLSNLRSPSRRRALVAARGVAVYLARHAAGHRLEEIGRYFGGRDHTTVMHSYRTTKELIAADPATRAAIDQLNAALWKT